MDLLDEMHRQTDRARLLGYRARRGLADPPCGVGREPVTAAIVEQLHRSHKACVALLNQIKKLQPKMHEAFYGGHHQPEICLYHARTRLL